MYEPFFGFDRKPFSVTPDPSFFYEGKTHRQGIAHLRYALRERSGFVLLSGEVGTGKTHLVRVLLDEIETEIRRALIVIPIKDPDQLFDSILQDLGVPFHLGSTFQERLEAFVEFLLEQNKHGRPTLIIVDECQNLSHEALERLRLLSNLETNASKLLQIILVGQPEINDILRRSDLRQLNQRITVRHHLQPLSRQDVDAYIKHRLEIAGGPHVPVRFTRGAVRKLHRATHGIPRLVSVLADYCLVIAYTDEKMKITRRIAREAVRLHRLRLEPDRPRNVRRWLGWFWKPVVAGVLCLLMVLGLVRMAEEPLVQGLIAKGQPLATAVVAGVRDLATEVQTSQAIAEAEPSARTTPEKPEVSSVSNPAPKPKTETETVVAEQPAPENEVVREEPVEDLIGERYGVQIASFRSVERAKRMAGEFAFAGPIYIVPSRANDGERWYRVVYGAFQKVEDAREQARQISESGMIPDCMVVKKTW